MWSSFAQKKLVSVVAPPPPPPPPPPPSQSQEKSEPEPEPEVHDISGADNSNNNSNSNTSKSGKGDAWSDDDDILEDDFLDEILDDDDTSTNDTAQPTQAQGKVEEASSAKHHSMDVGGIGNVGSSSGGASVGGIGSTGGIGGGRGGMWGSTLSSFASRQHEPLNLSSGIGGVPGMTSPTLATTSTSVAPAITATTDSAPSSAMPAGKLAADSDGWDDDEVFGDEDVTPKKGAAEIPTSLSKSSPKLLTPLGRAANAFGAALLASVDNQNDEEEDFDDEDEDYQDEEGDDFGEGDTQEEDEEEDEEAEIPSQPGGFGGGFVMKGLSRFIEAATAPQGEVSEEDSQEDECDGWGEEEDDLDFPEEDEEDDIGVEDVVEDVAQDSEKEADVKAPTPVVVEDMANHDSETVNEIADVKVSESQTAEVENEVEPMMEDTAMGDGWDDEDDHFLEESDNEEPVPTLPITVEDAAIMDSTSIKEQSLKKEEEEEIAAGADAMGEGWGDDDDILAEEPNDPVIKEDVAFPNSDSTKANEPDLQKEEDEEPMKDSGGDDGWEDDDVDISFNNVPHNYDTLETESEKQEAEDAQMDALNVQTQSPTELEERTAQPPKEPDLQKEVEEQTENAAAGGEDDGWDDDDIDLSINTPLQTPKPTKVTDSAKSSVGVPDSLKDFVAMTESNLDSQFNKFNTMENSLLWKTPPPKKSSAMARSRDLVEQPEGMSTGDKTVASDVRQPITMAPLTPATANGDVGKGEKEVIMVENNNMNLLDEKKSDKVTGEAKEEDAVPKSLAEFVDTLDAELAAVTNDADVLVAEEKEASGAVKADAEVPMVEEIETISAEPILDKEMGADPTETAKPKPMEKRYSYEENKDDSPEPLLQSGSPPTLPHQESWYLNAMEGGKGGVVYGEEALETVVPLQPHASPKGILPTDSASLSIGQCPSTSVGMPLSEMPSVANSVPSSKASSVDKELNQRTVKPSEQKSVALKPSELQCNCLELIMPLPERKNGQPPNVLSPLSQDELSSGFGTKKLPDGTSVLVNYEKLLQNEATKRILLQRSVEAYEHTVEQLKASNQTHEEKENDLMAQLKAAQAEVSELKGLIEQLQDEKENMANESQLFEAELSAAANDKEYLEREVETIQEDWKRKYDELLEQNNDVLAKMEEHSSLEESSRVERTRLIDQVEMLQSELSEVQVEKEVVQRQRDEFEEKVHELLTSNANDIASDATAETTETAMLRNTIESLQQELHEKNDEIEQLTGELREKDLLQQERDELNGKVEELMMSDTTVLESKPETDEAANETILLLRNEIESLQQELLQKNDEIDQLTSELGETQPTKENKASEHNKLREENDRLQNELSETKCTLARLRGDNENLCAMQRNNNIEITDLKATLESMGRDESGEVEKLAAEVTSLTYELGAKSMECEESLLALQSMQKKLDNAEARLLNYYKEKDQKDQEDQKDQKDEKDEKDDSILEEEKVMEIVAEEEKGNTSDPEEEKGSNGTNVKTDSFDELEESWKEMEESWRSENDILKRQLDDAQERWGVLVHDKFDLETSLEEREDAIRSLEMQIRSLNSHVADSSAALQGELFHARKALDEMARECDETKFQLQLVQARLDSSETLLKEYKNAPVEDNEVGNLKKQLADLQAANSLLESQKSEVEQKFEERTEAIETLNAKIVEARGELSRVKKSLKDKVYECKTIAASCEELKSELLDTQSNHDAFISKNEENASQAQEQVSKLQSQIAELLKDHNATMKNVEEQLTGSLQERTTLRAQCEDYRIKFEDAQKECANITHSTTDTIAQYTEQVSKLQGENLDLTAALQAAQSAVDGKQVEASRDASKVKKLQKNLADMQEEMDSIALRHKELLDRNLCLMQEKAHITQSLEAKAKAAEEQTKLLQQECDELRSSIDSSIESSAQTEQTLTKLKEQLQSLKDTNAQLEEKLFEASFDTPDRLAEENASLRKEREELKEESHALMQRITELSSRTNSNRLATIDSVSPDGAFTSVEKEALLARINELEEELRAENLNELRDELTSLHEERQQLDLDNEELLVQLGLIQQEKAENQTECEVEVDTMREQVSTLQDECKRLHNDLDRLKSQSSLPGDSDHAKKLQEENNSLHQAISQLRCENDSLRDQVNELTQKVEGLELENSQKVKTLRQKLGSLEVKLAEKEEEVEATTKEMQIALDIKDGEISKLTSECSSRENKLKDVSGKLDAANTEMGAFTSKLESLQSQYEQVQYNQTYPSIEEEKLFESDDDISLQDLLAEAVLDSDDHLRSQIVVLAQALERSELQRANALERIFSERKSNEESLRQLGESVKRFYSTVRCGDAA